MTILDPQRPRSQSSQRSLSTPLWATGCEPVPLPQTSTLRQSFLWLPLRPALPMVTGPHLVNPCRTHMKLVCKTAVSHSTSMTLGA